MPAKLLKRLLTPPIFVSVYYFLKYRCKVSPRSEVDLTPNLKIGRNTIIGSFAKIKAADGPMVIGANCSISSGSSIGADKGGVYIGDDCLIGSNVSIIGNTYDYSRIDVPLRLQGHRSKGIRIADNVFIGNGACINDGVKIGKNAMVAPNSYVTSNVPENAIVQGAPAKVIFIRR